VHFLSKFLRVALCVLLARALFLTLFEYRYYFPPDFSSSFLGLHRNDFGVQGSAAFSNFSNYQAAFYIHIVSAPICLIICVLLWIMPHRTRQQSLLHQLGGSLLITITLLLMLPSGLVLAPSTKFGLTAAWGLIFQGLATAMMLVATVLTALSLRNRKNVSSFREAHSARQKHKTWATRTLIMFLSPLILRIGSGVLESMRLDEVVCYQISVWCCWSVPLVIHEFWLFFNANAGMWSNRGARPFLTKLKNRTLQ